MPNYRLSLDISNIITDISKYNLREFNVPFLFYFLEAEDPDDACVSFVDRLITLLLQQDHSMEMRIFCRKMKRNIRIDKIETL